MICQNCGKQINDDSVFCNYCGAEVEYGAPSDNVIPDDYSDYEGYDEKDDLYFEPDTSEDDAAAPAYYEEVYEETDRASSEKGRRLTPVIVFLSVVFTLLTVFACLSGVARSASDEDNIRSAVLTGDAGASLIKADKGYVSISEHIVSLIEDAGNGSYRERDIKKLLVKDSFRNYVADICIEYKNELMKGKKIAPYDLGKIADWMYENGADVKSVLGKGLTDKKRDELKAALSASEIDPGVSSLEDVFGIDSLIYSFLSSKVFYAVCIVLAFGAAAMIFTLHNYKIRPFFTALGICALVAAIILMTLFGVIFAAKRSSAPLASVLLSASLMPFMIRGASLVLSGALLILLGNTVKKRKKRLDIGE